MSAVIVLLLILAVVWFVLGRERREAKKLGAKLHTAAMHLYGVPGLGQKEIVKLFFADDRLIIRAKKRTFELNYEKLTAIKAAKETDLVKADKSVLGRAAVGGLVLGPLGAIVGGMSAVGGKKNVRGELLILNYLPDGKSEPQPIIFNLRKMSNPKRIEKFVTDRRPELVEPSFVTL